MKILAIETSCDETAVALLECSGNLDAPQFKILSNALVSQIEMHKEFGGVVPMLAKREHEKNLPVLVEKVLKEARESLDKPDIDYVAVTAGPGLEPALWAGIVFSKEIGERWGIPVLPINHMEGHIYSTLFGIKERLILPAIALLVSGGHTELVHIKNYGEYEVIGQTRDDAVGEAFDKVARLLGLEYPGGPKISKLADLHRASGLTPTFELPRPMIHSNDYDFSFSGLKTSVLYRLKDQTITKEVQEEMARAFEDAAIEVLITKTEKALEEYGVNTLIVAGGVSANKYLRSELEKIKTKNTGLNLLLPENSLTTDNAVMIGITGFINLLKNPNLALETHSIEARGNLSLS
ncbi:MAG: tRNA (adenosine(37)-N6)-threonylcarbamoyltransferase complex transferase subunit TsaD [Minisyncoccia bacterium]